MPRRASGLTGSQLVSVQFPVRATAAEAETIRSAANEAGLSLSRYVVQAALQRARGGSPSPAEAPSRLDRRTYTLHRLKRAALEGTPEREALEWASQFCWMLRGGSPPPSPARGAHEVLRRIVANLPRRRDNVVAGSLGWAAKMAEWAESLVAGTAKEPDRYAPVSDVLGRLAATELDKGVSWAFRMARYLEGVERYEAEAPPFDAVQRIARVLDDPVRDPPLRLRERAALEWAVRLALLTMS